VKKRTNELRVEDSTGPNRTPAREQREDSPPISPTPEEELPDIPTQNSPHQPPPSPHTPLTPTMDRPPEQNRTALIRGPARKVYSNASLGRVLQLDGEQVTIITDQTLKHASRVPPGWDSVKLHLVPGLKYTHLGATQNNLLKMTITPQRLPATVIVYIGLNNKSGSCRSTLEKQMSRAVSLTLKPFQSASTVFPLMDLPQEADPEEKKNLVFINNHLKTLAQKFNLNIIPDLPPTDRTEGHRNPNGDYFTISANELLRH
jgi:hypothetical protein